MNNIRDILKCIILILVVALMIIVVLTVNLKIRQQQDSVPKEQLDSIISVIHKNNIIIDSLKFQNDSLTKEIQSKKETVIEKKIYYEKKIKDVNSLPADSSIMFFANYLSNRQQQRYNCQCPI